MHEHFAARLDDQFEIQLEAESIPVGLVSVSSLGVSIGTGCREEPFSLIFRGPLSPVAEQRSYVVTNETLGQMEIFLVPIGPDAQGMRYEAIFT